MSRFGRMVAASALHRDKARRLVRAELQDGEQLERMTTTWLHYGRRYLAVGTVAR